MFSLLMRSAVVVVLCCCLVSGPVWAAEAQYSNVAPDQPMREWFVLGPIPAQEAGATPDIRRCAKDGLRARLARKWRRRSQD